MDNRQTNLLFLALFAFVALTATALFLMLKQCSSTPKNNQVTTPETTEESALLPNKKQTPPSTGTGKKNSSGSENKQPTVITKTANEIQTKDNKTPDDSKTANAISQQFISAITNLDPIQAKKFVNTKQISYATIVGLCIMFEEGKYEMIQNRGLRQMFLRKNTAGYLARVKDASSHNNASFSITLKRTNEETDWKIEEINLDRFLSHYAEQNSGGDVFYTPLIKNPQGGESLAIYFDLDANELTFRTKKQLQIVADLLTLNPTKKLIISGHTDSLGSDHYNLDLSQKRALRVMEFLTEQGLQKNQIKITGFGKKQPRLPNLTKDGNDSPEGRRANRRAEILLDF